MLDLVRGLPERGYDTLIALKTPGPLGAVLDREGIPWFPIFTRRWTGTPRGVRYRAQYRLMDLLTARRVAARLRTTKVDLVHSNTLSSPVGAFIAHRLGAPHVWHMREAVDTQAGAGFIYGHDASSRLMNELTDIVIGNSKYIVEQTARYVERSKLRLLYGGNLDPADAAKPLPAREPLNPDRTLRLLMVGSVSPRKGQTDALEAVAALRDRGIDARLTVAGGGSEKVLRMVRDHASRFGVADRLDLLGHTDPRPLYASQDISLLCGPRDPIPRVAIESNAFGIPTVGIDSGGIPEVIEDGVTGWLCRENDPLSLADAIERAVRFPQEKVVEMLREGNRRAYERFNSTRYRDEGVAIYQSLGVEGRVDSLAP